MKTTFTLLFALIISVSLFAQTATSVADGNWFSPLTWGGTVPTPGYDVIINHNVILSSNWGYNTGSVTISSTGSLVQDGTNRAFGQQGGSFSNAGTVTISKMGFLGGTITNSGTLNGTDSLYLGINLTNTGTITSNNFYSNVFLTNNNSINVMNFFNNGTFDNVGTGSLNATNFFNNAVATNSSTITFNNCTNAGNLTNNNNIQGYNDFTNAGVLNNNSGANIHIQNNCTNGDSINHDSQWYNNGNTLIENDFTNIDILDGTAPGSFCVAINSANPGTVLGDFDFCDPSTGGFDLNTGTISNGITYCLHNCWTGIEENKFARLEVFPNPVKETLTIQFKGDISIKTIQIVNSCGQVVFEQSFNGTEEITISRNSLPAGLYLLKVSDNTSTLTKKLIFE